MSRIVLGAEGEACAAAYLESQGWSVLRKNFRVREGEIDLIARRGDVIAFVEVKTRRSRMFGSPAEAVTYRKQARIRALARRFIQETQTHARVLRFDVIEVRAESGHMSINHIEAAF